ncbi:MAG: hypothetical protein Q9164_006265, partial [Protoblastenia rupestris]
GHRHRFQNSRNSYIDLDFPSTGLPLVADTNCESFHTAEGLVKPKKRRSKRAKSASRDTGKKKDEAKAANIPKDKTVVDIVEPKAAGKSNKSSQRHTVDNKHLADLLQADVVRQGAKNDSAPVATTRLGRKLDALKTTISASPTVEPTVLSNDDQLLTSNMGSMITRGDLLNVSQIYKAEKAPKHSSRRHQAFSGRVSTSFYFHLSDLIELYEQTSLVDNTQQ